MTDRFSPNHWYIKRQMFWYL